MEGRLRLVIFFVDGLGLGCNDAGKNPLARLPRDEWARLLGGPLTGETAPVFVSDASLVPVDATMQVPGLPQSATGQAALFSGENTALILGRHYHGFPPRALCELLRRRNLLLEFRRRGGRTVFANMYTRDYMERSRQRSRRHSVTTEVARGAGLPLLREDDLRGGRAVYHDIDHSTLVQKGGDWPPRSPEEAGRVLAGLSRSHDLVLFEYFLTDVAGHAQDPERALSVLDTVSRCFFSLLDSALDGRTLVLLISDHGNVEDLSVKTHTCNPVPLLVCGPGHSRVARAVASLPDLFPVLLREWLEEGGEHVRAVSR